MRNTLLRHVEEMARAVSVTYGPRGRTVMLDRAGGFLSTKDGATVAWELESSDPVGNLGTRLLQAACAKVNLTCGDGTTTTAILVHAILREGVKWVAGGVEPALLAEELRRMAEALDECDLWAVTDPLEVEDEELLYQVALSSSNRDAEIARALVDALSHTGTAGMIVVEKGSGRGIEIEVKTGLDIDRGWESLDLAGPDGGPRQMEVPLVALVDATLTTMEHVTAILEEATQFPHPLVLVSRGVFGDALKVMVANDRKLKRPDGRVFEVMAVRAPGDAGSIRDHLEDLAALTGAKVLDPQVMSLKNPEPGFLGSAQSVTGRRKSSTFVAFPDKYGLIEQRVAQLRIEEARTASSHDVEEIRTRIAHLTGGLCVMKVGGASEVEIRERRARVEDALNAVRVAVDEGVMPGAGIAYLALSVFLRTGSTLGVGDRILAEALCEPLKVLAKNAGYEPAIILQRVMEAARTNERGLIPSWGTGWDAMTDLVRDLRESPVLCDPAAVVKTSIRTALSTAATLLTAEVALTR